MMNILMTNLKVELLYTVMDLPHQMGTNTSTDVAIVLVDSLSRNILAHNSGCIRSAGWAYDM